LALQLIFFVWQQQAKKSWENLVRNAEEVRELRSALQELEAVARGVQKIEDMVSFVMMIM
jgi:hypothetical protein